MPLLPKLTLAPRRSPIGIDVGGHSIKAMQLSCGPRGSRIEATAAFGRSFPNVPLDTAEVRRLAEVLRRRSFTGDQVVLAVPDDKLILGAMELPPRTAGVSLDAVARVEFARTYKCDGNAFEMGYWDVPAPARAARATNVMAVACLHPAADALIDLFATAGLDVVALDARPCAIARACSAAAENAPGIVVLLELGWNGAVLVVLHRNVVVYERTITESALKNLVSEIAAALRTEPDVAERLLAQPDLLGSAAPPPALSTQGGVPAELLSEVRAIVALHLEAVVRDITASVSYSSHQYPDAPVSRLLLLGGGAMIAGAAEQLESLLGFECRVVTPLASGSITAAPSVVRECNAALTTAAGLAQFQDD
jgi:type IV pilus assembly protein PilM